MTKKANRTSWKPGQSGNLRGRPVGSGMTSTMRERIAREVPEILDALTAAAKAGDVGAARLLLERALPSLRPEELPITTPLPQGPDLGATARAVLQAATSGAVSPAAAATLLGAMSSAARVIEVDELMRRIEALEVRANGKT